MKKKILHEIYFKISLVKNGIVNALFKKHNKLSSLSPSYIKGQIGATAWCNLCLYNVKVWYKRCVCSGGQGFSLQEN